MKPEEIFLKPNDIIDNNFIEVIKLKANVGGTQAIQDLKIVFRVSTNPIPVLYGSDKHLNIEHLLTKDDVKRKINSIKEITMINEKDCIYFLKKFKYDSNKAITYILTKIDENKYIDKLEKLKKIYNSNLLLDISNNDIDFVYDNLATFYNSYNYTKGLIELLENEDHYKNYRIKIETENYPNYYQPKFKMEISIFIDKMYLNNLYENYKIPRLLYNIMIEKALPKNIFQEIYVNNVVSNIPLKKVYKRTPYPYQIDNIIWMKNKEENTDNILSTYLLTNDHSLCKIDGLNEPFILDKKNKKMIDPNKLDNVNLKSIGGVLADEIGLGKTFSMIGLIAERLNPDNYPTLVLCPSRLCKQWDQEIQSTFEMKTCIIGTIRQFEKLKKNNIKDYDVIIVSYSFLINQKYIEYLEDKTLEGEKLILSNIYWERIILDEGHEYLLYKMMTKSLNRNINEVLYCFKSKFKWICSGTPYFNNRSCNDILSYICNIELPENYNKNKTPGIISKNNDIINNNLYHIKDLLLKNLFRKNTKDKIKEQIQIPEPIIETKFLIQNEIENAIYTSVLGDKKKMIQMCSHVGISDENIAILGNNPLSLDEIHKKMTEYYEKKVKRQKRSLEILENKMDIDEVEDPDEDDNYENLVLKKDELINEIKANQAKYNIFNNLENKLKEDSCCPVCMEELENKVKAIIPCGHIYCAGCIGHIVKKFNNNCPMCRFTFTKEDLEIVKATKKDENENNINKWGTKMAFLIKYLEEILVNLNNRIIVFSQWDSMLKLVGKVLDEFNIKYLNLNGSIHVVNGRIRRFKLDESIRIVLMSSEKSASGLNLQEANHIVLLDTMNTDKDNSKIIEDQAIGRAARIGQKNKVQVLRLIMQDTIEHDYFLRNTQKQSNLII